MYHKLSASTFEYETEECSCCSSKRNTGIFILLCLLLLIPGGTLTVGMSYRHDCPIQTWIPTWLIVFGAVGLATGGILMFIVRSYSFHYKFIRLFIVYFNLLLLSR